jgi:DNA-directed RNA polymerase subunit RPC12/RpoP
VSEPKCIPCDGTGIYDGDMCWDCDGLGHPPIKLTREDLMPVSCISCGAPFDPDNDPVPTTLGVRCANCWTGHRTSQLGRY